MTHYIFVVSDSTRVGPEGAQAKSAREKILTAAKAGYWPLNSRTRHQKDAGEGDRCLFYVSGQRDEYAGSLVAEAVVSGPREVSKTRTIRSQFGLSTATLYDLPITALRWLPKTVPVRPLIDKLQFIEAEESWGSYFHGGIVRVPEADYRLIVARSER